MLHHLCQGHFRHSIVGWPGKLRPHYGLLAYKWLSSLLSSQLHPYGVEDNLRSGTGNFNGGHRNNVLTFSKSDVHGCLYVFRACHLLDVDYLGGLGKIQSGGNLIHHLLAGAYDQDSPIFLLQQC